MTLPVDVRPLRITPALCAGDPLARYWLGQAHARLRRELAWAWHERGTAAPDDQALPAFTDRAGRAVDLVRRWDEKIDFFATDPAARYLSGCIAEPEPAAPAAPARGSFAWVAAELGLAPLERFWLALALSSASDAAVGAVMAACTNDPARTRPSLGLAQQLWDLPAEVGRLCDPALPLHRIGLVVTAAGAHIDWDAPAAVPPLLVPRLLGEVAPAPASLIEPDTDEIAEGVPLETIVRLLASAPADRLRVVAVQALRGDAAGAALALAGHGGRRVLRVRDEIAGAGRDHLDALATWAWLADVDLFLPAGATVAIVG
ncbi:MAG TPA: hypothetical protein VL172_10835, partial [Kofleriaceae bacterium]|nr:hypothetical protein [Kofleriaceae bacterium]